MSKRKIVTYYNERYKGNLDEATCNILESLISAEAENSEITDLRNVIYDYDKATVANIIAGCGSYKIPSECKRIGTLRPEQTIGVGYLYAVKNCILGDSVGLGKTVEVAGLYNLLNVERSKQGKEPIRALVLTEKTLASQLREELVKFTGDFFELVPSGLANDIKEFTSSYPIDMPMYASVVGTHALFTTAGFIAWLEQYKKIIGEFPFDMLVVDESSPLGGKQTNNIVQGYKAIAKYFERIIFLNATPFDTKLEVFYNQLNLLDPVFLPTKTDFNEHFCVMRWVGSYGMPTGKYKNQEEFKKLIKYRYLARTRKDRGAVMENCAGGVIYSELSDAQKELLPLTQMPQLVYDCPTYLDEDIDFDEENVPKLASLMSLLENECEDADSILMFVYYKETQKLLYDWLTLRGYSAEVLNGESSSAERANVVNGFKNGAFRILITNVQKGLNFGDCNYCIFYSFDANPSRMIQFEGRTTRSFDIVNKNVYLLCSKGREEKRLKQVVRERAKATSDMTNTDLSVIMGILLAENEHFLEEG